MAPGDEVGTVTQDDTTEDGSVDTHGECYV